MLLASPQRPWGGDFGVAWGPCAVGRRLAVPWCWQWSCHVARPPSTPHAPPHLDPLPDLLLDYVARAGLGHRTRDDEEGVRLHLLHLVHVKAAPVLPLPGRVEGNLVRDGGQAGKLQRLELPGLCNLKPAGQARYGEQRNKMII